METSETFAFRTAAGLARATLVGDTLVRLVLDQHPATPSGGGRLVEREITDYFDARLVNFSVPYKAEGTLFQMQTWEEVAKIPFGETASYADIAKRIDRPEAWRAVANACNANPIWLIIPCHRVIGSNGNLGGYEYGHQVKEHLLAHEARIRSSLEKK